MKGLGTMSTRSAIIYSIYCIPEDKYYVGQTGASLKRRIKQHYSAGEYKGDEATLIDQTLQLYSQDDFIIQQIECCDDDVRNEREQYWISYYDCMKPNGYNCTPGGGFNRVTLTDDELEEMKKQYLQGKSLAQLSMQYDVSTSTVKKYLQQLDVPIRTLQEQQQFNNSHLFYRMDLEHHILQTYNSFSEIGQWLIDNDLTTLTDAACAGVAIRYAMLFDREMSGFLWDTNLWTPEEKAANRKTIRETRKTVSARQKTKQRRYRPTRSELMESLQQHSVRELATQYGVQAETIRKWCTRYYLSTQGEDISEPNQDVPEEFVIKHTVTEQSLEARRRVALSRSKCPLVSSNLDGESFLYDIATSSIAAVARKYNVTCATITRWCQKYGYPDHIDAIRDYVCKQYNLSLTDLSCDSSSKNRQCTPEHPSGRYPIDIDELLIEIAQTSFSAVGKKYRVSSNAVKKWCRNHDRPWRINDIKAYVQEHHLLQ